MAALPGVTVTRTGYRRVAATCAAPPATLLRLRTVDDVFVELATWDGLGRPRSALAALAALSRTLDLYPAAALCGGLRPIGRLPSFAVTASFVGKRNYNTEEIKSVLADGISTGHGWPYRLRDEEADLNVRLFMEHETAFVGIRIGRRPLQERPYQQVHRTGSLKPPVAAAMLALAEVQPGLRLLDPCCGAGTILIEAALRGVSLEGGDSDPEAVAAAQANAAAAGVAAIICQWDARALPLPDASVDRIVSNLPWGRQVAVDGALELFYRQVGVEIRRVLAPGGQVAILTSTPHLVELSDLRCTASMEISLFGQTPTIMVFSA